MSHDTLLSKRADLMDRHDKDETNSYGDTVCTLLAMELWRPREVAGRVAVGAAR